MNQIPGPRDSRIAIEGRVSAVHDVIYRGRPSQVVNLPTYINVFIVAVLLLIAQRFVLMSLRPVPPFMPLILSGILLLVVLVSVVAWLRTQLTEVIIDTARVTIRQGILTRRVDSLELFRIQNVFSLHPWWQRPFGIGLVVLLTSDSDNPRWALVGLRHAEQLRAELNQAAIALRDAKGIREVNMGRV